MIQNFSANFYSRSTFRYIGIIAVIFSLYYFVQLDSKALAMLLLIRSALEIASAAISPMSSGQIFYKKFYLTKYFDEIFFPHFFKSALVIILIGFFLISIVSIISNYIEILDLTVRDYVLIFLWLVFLNISNIFQHYFQMKKLDFLSGASNGSVANCIVLILLILSDYFDSISFSIILSAFSLGWVLNALIFSIVIFSQNSQNFFLVSKKYNSINFFLDKNIYYESIIGILQRKNPFLLWFSVLFLNSESVSILGLFFYTAGIFSTPRQAFLFSIRGSCIQAFSSRDQFIDIFKNFKKNMFLINLFCIFLTLLLSFFLFNEVMHEIGPNFAENFEEIALLLLIHFFAILILDFYVGFFESLLVLKGSASYFVKIKIIEIVVAIVLLTIISIYSISIYSFVLMNLVTLLFTKLLAKRHFINLKLL